MHHVITHASCYNASYHIILRHNACKTNCIQIRVKRVKQFACKRV